MSDMVFYVANQGDVTDFHACKTVAGESDADSTIENIKDTAAAVLKGWFAQKGEPMGCVTQAFVVGITQFNWQVFDVEFTSDSLSECVIEKIDCGVGISTAPTGFPCFVTT